jgi:16S rRNA (cytidine1402-2'-O)-methyltransferase
MNGPTLYVVGTPIGNMEDISLRALRVLKGVDLILCEDTRVTKKLLDKYEVKTKTRRLDAHKEGELSKEVSSLFAEYNTIALVTDAGTPAISDPGYRFVAAVRKAGIEVIAIPGPSALVSALSVSGLPTDQFVFLGFLPHKKGRETLFEEIASSKRTVVFYESTHRLVKTLEKLQEALEPVRTVVVAKELTKIFEEIITGTASEVLEYFLRNEVKQKGEFVIIVKGL